MNATRRRRIAAAIAGAALTAVLAAGCGGGDSGGPDGSSGSPTAATEGPGGDSGGDAGGAGAGDGKGARFAADWQPRLDELPESAVADCLQPSTHACAQAIDAITEVVLEMETDLATRDLEATYPKTVAQLDKMHEGAVAYDTEACEDDPAADIDGSPCFQAAVDVTVGPSILGMVMSTDESNARIAAN